MVLLEFVIEFDVRLAVDDSDADSTEEPALELGLFGLDVCAEDATVAVGEVEADTEGVVAVVVLVVVVVSAAFVVGEEPDTVAAIVVVATEVVLASTLEPVISIKVKTDITKAVAIRSDAPWTRILSVCSYKL